MTGHGGQGRSLDNILLLDLAKQSGEQVLVSVAIEQGNVAVALLDSVQFSRELSQRSIVGLALGVSVPDCPADKD